MGLRKQVAALPFRRSGGETQVLLVTSRETGRWVIPKGWHSKGLKAPQAAAREAREEAGVAGKIGPEPVGHFSYIKQEYRADGPINVTVFLLAVRKELKRWPEKDERRRAWFAVDLAAEQVQEPELSSLIRGLDCL